MSPPTLAQKGRQDRLPEAPSPVNIAPERVSSQHYSAENVATPTRAILREDATAAVFMHTTNKEIQTLQCFLYGVRDEREEPLIHRRALDFHETNVFPTSQPQPLTQHMRSTLGNKHSPNRPLSLYSSVSSRPKSASPALSTDPDILTEVWAATNHTYMRNSAPHDLLPGREVASPRPERDPSLPS